MELRKWLRERIMVNMRSLITIEEKVGECDRPQLQDGDSQQQG